MRQWLIRNLRGAVALTALLVFPPYLALPLMAQQSTASTVATKAHEPRPQTSPPPSQTGQTEPPEIQALPSAAAPAERPQMEEAPTPGAAALADSETRANNIMPHELSPWSMFLSADKLVKAVIIGLAFASLLTWTVFIAKSFELTRARKRLIQALDSIGAATTLAEAQLQLGQDGTVLARMVAAAIHEAKLSSPLSSDSGIKERAASFFTEISRAEAKAMRHGMGLLATIGATSPFVGLFGTVWGIMNSFIGISKAQTTNLAVVAPGIAEALLATAIGLGAAIPAVIIYNHFSRAAKNYLDLITRATGATGRLLSRDLDRRYGGAVSARAAE
ncbi:MAG TPA: tonB-system energizer ExbB [Methylocella sp.]|nr:tonB-system energizer ExbB [Methylocella sp.]